MDKVLDRRIDKWDKLHPEQHEEDVAPSLGPLCSTREPQECSGWFPVQGWIDGLEKEQQMLLAGLEPGAGREVGWDLSAPCRCPGDRVSPSHRAQLAPKDKGHSLQLQAGQ